MRKRLKRWEWAGFFFVSAAGTLLHFVFDWAGGSAPAAAVSAVNESTWEHMKLLFLPWFVFTMAEYAALGEAARNFFAVKAAAGLVGLAVIPTLFYTLTGCFGELAPWVNIGIFYVAVAAAFFFSARALRAGLLRAEWMQAAGFLLLWLVLAAFVLFTYRTPRLPLFRDPLTGGYGYFRP